MPRRTTTTAWMLALGPLGDEGVELAELGGVEADLGWRGDGPAVVERHRARRRLSAFLRRRGERERQQRQQKHESLAIET